MRRGLILLLTALLMAGCAQPSSPVPAPNPPAEIRTSPPAAPGAFHGLGRLAYTHYGHLYVLDGDTNTVREIEGVTTAWPLAWSADGRWLSFGAGDGQYRVVDATTWQAYDIPGLPGPVSWLAWAPTGHSLAAATAAGILLLDDPLSGKARMLAAVAPKTPGALAWAPDGSRIAYVTTGENRDEVLNVVSVSDGQTAPWYVAQGSGIELGRWWPDSKGFLFWVRPMHCNSCAVDGLPLFSLALGAETPVTLPGTLLHLNWLTFIGDELLMVRGGGRIAWDNKNLARCSVTAGDCHDLPQPETVVTQDPALAPGGSRLAVVRAERRPSNWSFSSQAEVQTWMQTRKLWLLHPDGTEARQLPAAGTAISGPDWARDGRHLLYADDGALRLLDVETGENQPLLALDGGGGQGYYGQLNYARQYAWFKQ